MDLPAPQYGLFPFDPFPFTYLVTSFELARRSLNSHSVELREDVQVFYGMQKPAIRRFRTIRIIWVCKSGLRLIVPALKDNPHIYQKLKSSPMGKLRHQR